MSRQLGQILCICNKISFVLVKFQLYCKCKIHVYPQQKKISVDMYQVWHPHLYHHANPSAIQLIWWKPLFGITIWITMIEIEINLTVINRSTILKWEAYDSQLWNHFPDILLFVIFSSFYFCKLQPFECFFVSKLTYSCLRWSFFNFRLCVL